jgi:hypothetical protein
MAASDLTDAIHAVADSIGDSFGCDDFNNAVDVLKQIAQSGNAIAGAITPVNAAPGRDESGGYVASLTEAVMSVGAGLHRIAESLQGIADAIHVNNSKSME